MKLAYPTEISAIKHEFDPREEVLLTTLHLDLPSGVDLKGLQQVHRRFKDPRGGIYGEFHLTIRDEDGSPRRHRLISRGTKTKDFVLCAVVCVPFNEHHRFEQLLDQAHVPEDDRPEVTLEAELIIPEPPLLATLRQMDEDLAEEGVTVTFTAGGKSATLGKKDNHDA